MRVTITKNNRTFNCEVAPELSGAMASVMVYEVVRPHWVIFKSTYCGSRTFWIKDYPTIRDGVDAVVNFYLNEEKYEQMLNNKWKEFENND